MKSKKSIIFFVLVVAIALCGFTIYKVIDNKKVSQEQEQSKQTEEVVNKKDEDGKDVKNGNVPAEVQDTAKVVQFFTNCLNVSFNVDVTSKEQLESVKKFQKENFVDTYATLSEKNYSKYKESLKVEDIQVKSVKQMDISFKGQTLNGYAIEYIAKIQIDGKDDILEDTEGKGFATALISNDNNKLTLIQFATKSK